MARALNGIIQNLLLLLDTIGLHGKINKKIIILRHYTFTLALHDSEICESERMGVVRQLFSVYYYLYGWYYNKAINYG